MKTSALIFIFAVACYVNSFSQQSNTIRVKAGDDFMTSLSKQIYRYPKFVYGIVVSKDGLKAASNLNLNMLIGEMQFIDPKGDTLSIANEETIKYITIDKDSFFYDKGYLELITSNPTAKLAIKQRFKVVDKQKIGAYDQPSSAGSIESKSFYYNGSYSYKLDVRQDLLIAKEAMYYIGDKYNNFMYANKRNLLRLFSKNQNEVQQYLKENNVNFTREEDMKKLVVFLNGI